MKTISIRGEEYPVRVTMGAMLRFADEFGKEPSDLQGVADAVRFLWCVVAEETARLGKEFPLDVREFARELTPDGFAKAQALLSDPAGEDASPNA